MKLECVGHVQKRCGTRLWRLKAENRGKKLNDGKGLAGAGRLTDKIMNTLQNYFGLAIRQNSNNLDKMTNAVRAVLPLVASSEKIKCTTTAQQRKIYCVDSEEILNPTNTKKVSLMLWSNLFNQCLIHCHR